MAEIKLDNITKSYGDRTIIKDFSLSVEDGECFTILGPSPCGKTTILRAICGFEKLDSGEISIGKNLVFSKEKNVFVRPEKRDIGVVFQDYAVWPHMTVYENIYYPLKKRNVPKKEANQKAMDAINQVAMKPFQNRLPYQLSGGQQQRVALARALVSSNGLIMLDEPLCNLDANLREEMRFEIKELQKKIGVTIIYVTHDQEVALAISDRIAVMDRSGSIRQIGIPENIYKNPEDSFVFKFLGLSNFIPLSVKGKKLFIEKDGSGSAGHFPYPLPPHIEADRLHAACRPKDVKLKGNGKLKCKVLQTIFLGDSFEYRVLLGTSEIRIQQDSFTAFKNTLFKQGDICGIEFDNLRYYTDIEEV